MRSWWRWTSVAAATAVLISLPWLIAHRPVPSESMSAATLLSRIQGSARTAYSGYAEASGGLQLPVTAQFGSLADLLGGTTELRVWWRDAQDWRVDTVSFAGENDLYRDSTGYWAWNYERLSAVRTDVAADPAVRLPRAGDLLPPELARRLLSQARPGQVSRLDVRRIAGVDAAGLRLRPNDPASSVDHVDVWADPTSGIALRVVVYGKGTATAVVSTAFLDYSGATPSAQTTAFVPQASARISTSNELDLLSAGRSVRRVLPPAQLAGLALNTANATGNASVASYGRGVTELIAIPLRYGFSDRLLDQLAKAPGAVTAGDRVSVGAGPVNLIIFTGDRGNDWLLTGTVTAATLTAAADQLNQGFPGPR